MNNEILEAARRSQPQIVADRRFVHKHPEIGFDLPNTSSFIQKRLSEMGIESQICGGVIDEKTREAFKFAGFPDMANSTGVVATIGSGSPCILLRADMDALPMSETAGLVDFTSEVPGIAHMCGHDTHTAMLLGAAKILKDMEKELCGTVKLMFQTGEECGCGSRFMVEHGVLENPRVDAAFALHIMPQEKKGTVRYTKGVTSAAMDTFMVKIKGKGGHSSMPQSTIDPLMIANQLYTTLNLVTCREIDPRETVALTAGKCGGGTAANVIPDTAEIMTGIRTFSKEVRDHLNQRVPEIVEHTVKMWRGEYDMMDFHTPSTFNDPDFAEEVVPLLQDIAGADNVSTAPCMAGTEDFGYITEKVPGMFAVLGGGDENHAPVHNPNMTIDEDILYLGAALHAGVAAGWLIKHKG